MPTTIPRLVSSPTADASDKRFVNLEQLITALVESQNQAADDVLLEALAIGDTAEQAVALEGLTRRGTTHGITGVLGFFARLAEPLQAVAVEKIKSAHTALRAASRNADYAVRLAAMRVVAVGRQGKLAYLLAENLRESDEALSQAACDALLSMSRWVAETSRAMSDLADDTEAGERELMARYAEMMDQRPDIEAAVARGMDVVRTRHAQDLLRAALLLCDWPGSRTLAILKTSRHGGQATMVRRLQQPPSADHVEAFLLGASHGHLRSHFGVAVSHVTDPAVLDGLVRRVHWLKDQQLRLCVHQVTQGVWWEDAGIERDLARRTTFGATKVAAWLTASGMHDALQDGQIEKMLAAAPDDFAARLQLLRLVAERPMGASVTALKTFLRDNDERIARMAARELIRRKPPEYENALLQQMNAGHETVRALIRRALGQSGFDSYWNRFDRMDRATRKQAGRAMMKLLPDALALIGKRLNAGVVEERVRAMQIVQELGLAKALRDTLVPLCAHSNARVRSKAVSLLGDIPDDDARLLIERALNDSDARVRANAIEVLETKRAAEFVPMLIDRARSTHSRERANAVKALHRLRIGTAGTQLLNMLRDERSEHRIGAMWALRQIGWWQLLGEVATIAKTDQNIKARRYAVTLIKSIAELSEKQNQQPILKSA